MTFNSRLAKLAEKLAEETFPLKMYLDESLPKLAQSSFNRGALHPQIEAAIRAEAKAATYRAVACAINDTFKNQDEPCADLLVLRNRFADFAKQQESEVQRLLSEGGEN